MAQKQQGSSPSQRKKSRIFSFLKNAVFFLVIFLIIQTWMQRNMANGEAPAFQTTFIDGESITLAAYQGKPLILHFWASWCPICKFEEGSISDLNSDKEAQLLTVAFQSGNPEEIKQFLSQQRIENWPVVVDEQGAIANKYGVTGVPATFFIDSKGKIRFKTRGLTSKWGLKFRFWLTSFY